MRNGVGEKLRLELAEVALVGSSRLEGKLGSSVPRSGLGPVLPVRRSRSEQFEYDDGSKSRGDYRAFQSTLHTAPWHRVARHVRFCALRAGTLSHVSACGTRTHGPISTEIGERQPNYDRQQTADSRQQTGHYSHLEI